MCDEISRDSCSNISEGIYNISVNEETENYHNTKSFKRIMYTKEFLLMLQWRSKAMFFPNKLPKFCINANGYWDPEKYFDLMKLAQNSLNNNENNQTEDKTQKNNSIIFMSGDSIDIPIIKHENSQVTNSEESKSENSKPGEKDNKISSSIINIEKIKSEYKLVLNPGDSYEIIFCAIDINNNFYVNPIALICALHEFNQSINNYCNAHLKEDEQHKSNQRKLVPKIGDILFAKSIIDAVWYRGRVIRTSDAYTTVFAIDSAKTFETVNTLLVPCPDNFRNVPAFALNIGLAGIQTGNYDTRVLTEFLRRQISYKVKIIFSISEKYYVELFNEKNISLNCLLNPRFHNKIYGSAVEPK